MDSTLSETITKNWDKRTHTGRNFERLAEWAEEHEQTGITKGLLRISGLMNKAGIPKGQTLDITATECLPKGEEYECQNCGRKHIKNATRIAFKVDGRPLLPGNVGETVGDECFTNLIYISEAARDPDFELPETDERTIREQTERYAKIKISLSEFSKKAVDKLRKLGFDLDTTVPAEAADEMQKALFQGDSSPIKGAGGCRDLIGWGVKEFRNITDTDVKYTTGLMKTKQFKRITPEQWNEFILYAWQNRLVDAEGELGNIREDILYLSDPKTEAARKTIEKFGSVDLKKELTPIRLFDKTEWENITLEEALTNRKKVTKAQSRAVRATVPYLPDRRISHNQEIISKYCDAHEFGRMLRQLEEKYEKSKQEYIASKKQGIKKPDTSWKLPYKSLKKAFFDKKEKIEETGQKLTLQEILLRHTPMKNADEAVRTLYVEARKIQLAEKLETPEVYKQEYITIEEAAKILSNNAPTRISTSIKRLEGFRALIEALKLGIVPTTAVQRVFKESRLEQLFKFKEKDDIARQIRAAAEAYRRMDAFYKEYKVYNNNDSISKGEKIVFNEEYPGSLMHELSPIPLILKKDAELRNYRQIDEELKAKIKKLAEPRTQRVLGYEARLPHNIEAVIEDEKTRISPSLASAIEALHDRLADKPEAIVFGRSYPFYINPENKRFDIIANGSKQDLISAFSKKTNPKPLLAWAEHSTKVGNAYAERGEWYGTGVTRERLAPIIEKAKETNITIMIVGSYKS